MTVTDQEPAFDASVYDLPIPYKADRLSVGFSGSIELDRTSREDLDFLNALEFGSRHTFTVDVVVTKAAPTLSVGKDENPDSVGFGVTLRVEAVNGV